MFPGICDTRHLTCDGPTQKLKKTKSKNIAWQSAKIKSADCYSRKKDQKKNMKIVSSIWWKVVYKRHVSRRTGKNRRLKSHPVLNRLTQVTSQVSCQYTIQNDPHLRLEMHFLMFLKKCCKLSTVKNEKGRFNSCSSCFWLGFIDAICMLQCVLRKQNQFDSTASTTARAIETLMGQYFD